MGGFQVGDGAATVRRMRVDPDHQRRGYGTRLLTAFEGRARERGLDRAVLETHVRLTAARRLYEDQGYEEVGRETDGPTGDEFVRYGKPL